MKLGIVIPCYNEVDVLPETGRRMVELLSRLAAKGKISSESLVYLVDDGSSDGTWELVERLVVRDRRIVGVKLSRNRGHQTALIAGLFTADGDAVISIDADLQDDINVIEQMVDRFRSGDEIVYGVRKERPGDKLLKRVTAETFYRILRSLGAESIYNHADYRLLSRRVVECLKTYREVNLYLRGIIPLIGFRSSTVFYDRGDRFAGKSKYPLRRMIALALDAVTSFSIVPLRLITVTGFVIFAASIAVTLWVLWVRLFGHNAVPGWASIVLPLCFFGGLQLLCTGMLGEYLGKTYAEVKARPRFFIERIESQAFAQRLHETPALPTERSSAECGPD
jgi:glycosyltransferase involved in cell wall biosynthesis